MAVSIACIAVRGKRVLIAHRNPTGQMGGRWEFPGGKLDSGEGAEDAILREMREEFGVQVRVIRKITESQFTHDGKSFALHVYHVEFPHSGKAPDPEFALTEHTGYEWVEPKEIDALNFVDSDLAVLPKVKDYVLSLGA